MHAKLPVLLSPKHFQHYHIYPQKEHAVNKQKLLNNIATYDIS